MDLLAQFRAEHSKYKFNRRRLYLSTSVYEVSTLYVFHNSLALECLSRHKPRTLKHKREVGSHKNYQSVALELANFHC
jgi:hypothetical protein